MARHRARRFTARKIALLSAVLALTAGGAGVAVAMMGGDATPAGCVLDVPANPLTAAGLVTPYRLHGCDESVTAQQAFVEATILDPATGALSIYRPLVVNAGDAPAITPVAIQLPAGAVVGIWVGYNGGDSPATGQLTLEGDGEESGNCVDGLGNSAFGQVSFCGAAGFFTAANRAIRAGKLHVPALGTTTLGAPCPTTRSFGVVDQDQSDNVTTTYVDTGHGIAQDTGMATGPVLKNGSDNRLLDAFIDPALGCTPFTAPDLTTGKPSTSQALNELQAAADQAAPVALVPLTDPMTEVDGRPSAEKTNAYRAGVDQPRLTRADTAAAYCANLATVGTADLLTEAPLLVADPSSPTPGTDLLAFLRDRLAASLQTLGCVSTSPATPTGTAPPVTSTPATSDGAPATTTSGTGANGKASQMVCPVPTAARPGDTTTCTYQ